MPQRTFPLSCPFSRAFDVFCAFLPCPTSTSCLTFLAPLPVMLTLPLFHACPAPALSLSPFLQCLICLLPSLIYPVCFPPFPLHTLPVISPLPCSLYVTAMLPTLCLFSYTAYHMTPTLYPILLRSPPLGYPLLTPRRHYLPHNVTFLFLPITLCRLPYNSSSPNMFLCSQLTSSCAFPSVMCSTP